MHASAETLPPTAKGLVPRLPLYLVLIVFTLGVRSMLRRARLVSYYNVTSWRYQYMSNLHLGPFPFPGLSSGPGVYQPQSVSVGHHNNQATPWNVLATNLDAACRLIVVGGSILYS